LISRKQVTFQASREIAAVLDAPQQILIELEASPRQSLEMPGRGRRDDFLAQLTSDLVNGDESVGALVNGFSKLTLCGSRELTHIWVD
jgi:hypothetical protein